MTAAPASLGRRTTFATLSAVRLSLAILVVASVSAFDGALAAAAPPKPISPTSAVSQYIESLPASDGPRFTRSRGSAQSALAPLPPAAAQAVRREGGPQAQTLVEIASDPAFAAPASRPATKAAPRGGGGTKAAPSGGATTKTAASSPPVAGTGAEAGAAGAAAGTLGRSWVLLAGLLGVSALVVGARRVT